MTIDKRIDKRIRIRVATTLDDITAVADQTAIELDNLAAKARREGWTGAALATRQIAALQRLKNEAVKAIGSVAQTGTVLGEMWQESGGDLDVTFVWQAVSSNVCPTCEQRNGEEHTYADWLLLGLPGSGATLCGHNCHCRLVRVDAERLRPVKLERTKGPRGGKGPLVAVETEDNKPVSKESK